MVDLNGLNLKAALKKLNLPYGDCPARRSLYWNEDFFGRSTLSLDKSASATEQQQILWHRKRMTLEEALFSAKKPA